MAPKRKTTRNPNPSDNTRQTTLDVITIKQNPSKSHFEKALSSYENSDYEKALDFINRAIENDNNNFKNYNLKGLILTGLKRFDEAINEFNRALDISQDDSIRLSKANCLYDYAKITFFPENDLDKALILAEEALNTLPETQDKSEFYFLIYEIYQSMEDPIQAKRYYCLAEGNAAEAQQLEDELEQFKIHEADTLINITGTDFYEGFKPFEKGVIVKLIKDSENEHDPDAIAVMIDKKVVGYVANSPYTLIMDVKSASDIKNRIGEDSSAEVLFIFQNTFIIARLL